MEKVAIVILNYNGLKFLAKFLPDVIQHSEGHTIYVADNASTDNSREFLSEKFPQVKQILLKENYGFCGGYNRAIDEVDEEYCILVNSDVKVTKHWIEPLLTTLQSDQQIAAVQPKILSFHQPSNFEYAGAGGGFIDKYGYPFCQGRIFDTLEKDEGQYDTEREIFWATGACMMVKKTIFKKFNGFDETFFAHMEEIDLCWRFKNAGFRVMYCPSSKVHHVGGGTLPKNNPKKVYLNFRNSLFMLVKNLPSDQVFLKVFLRMVFDFPAALLFLIRGSFKNFLMVIKAHLTLYGRLSTLIKERDGVKIDPKSTAGFYPKSILIAYFIRGKRKYTEL